MLKWLVIFVLVVILVGLVLIFFDDHKIDKFEDVYMTIPITSQMSTLDIKTRLYTELPETLDDFENIKNNLGYYRLSNGLEVILFHCPDYSNQITVEAAINSGFITDPEGYDELNHLIEHAIFLKTKNFNSLLDMQKLIPLADYNGQTGQTDVIINWTLTSPVPDTARNIIYLSRMLFVLKEMIYNAEFNHDKFEPEKNILMREFDISASNVSNNHDNNMGKEVYKHTDFQKIYGTKPENIAKITPEIATEYYRKFYQPDNMRVFIYGNLPNWPIELSTGDNKEGKDSNSNSNTGANNTTNPVTAKPITTRSTSLVKQIETNRLKHFYGRLLKSYFVDNPDEVIKVDDLYADLVAEPDEYPSTALLADGQLQQLGYEYTFDIATIQEWLKQSQSRLLAKNPPPPIEFITNGPVEQKYDDPKITQSTFYALFRHPKFKNQELVATEDIITSILFDKLYRVLREENGLVYGVDVSNNTILYETTSESYVIACTTGVQDIDKFKSLVLAEVDKMHQGRYITNQEYTKYQTKNKAVNNATTDCLSENLDNSILSDFKIMNCRFTNDIYDKISLETLNQIVAFIFDPNVCEIFIFANPSPSPSPSPNPSPSVSTPK